MWILETRLIFPSLFEETEADLGSEGSEAITLNCLPPKFAENVY